jgi:7-keto-8-aminopelargonate synthetase-like enzyme
MSDIHFRDALRSQLDDLRQRGLYKRERLLLGPQGSAIRVGEREVINFCANNYLGLANHPGRAAPLWIRHGLRPLYLRHARPP